MSDPDVRLPFDKIDWSLQLVHFTSGTLADYRVGWEQGCMFPKFKRRFYRALHELLPAEQGKYAIFGGSAFNCYNLPRETQDVDIAIVLKDFDAIAGPLEAQFPPPYEFKRVQGQLFVHYREEKVADLVIAEMNAVLLAALKHPKGTRLVHVPRFGRAWTVSAEAFIAAKFFSASEKDRGLRRMRDATDMFDTLTERENQPLDLDLLRRLVAFVPWVGAIEKFEEILRAVHAGKFPPTVWGPDESEGFSFAPPPPSRRRRRRPRP